MTIEKMFNQKGLLTPAAMEQIDTWRDHLLSGRITRPGGDPVLSGPAKIFLDWAGLNSSYDHVRREFASVVALFMTLSNQSETETRGLRTNADSLARQLGFQEGYNNLGARQRLDLYSSALQFCCSDLELKEN